MASILNDTLDTAKNVMDSTRDNAEAAFATAKDGATRAAATTRTALLDGAHTVSDLLDTLRSLDRDDALGWVGLQRRRSPLVSFAILSAGIAVGVGIGMLLAPMEGGKLRDMILAQLRGAKDQAQQKIDQAATVAKDAEQKVEDKVGDLAGKANDAVKQAGDAVKTAERKVEDKVNQGVAAAKETLTHQVGAAASAANTIADEIKMSSVNRPRTAAIYTNGNTRHHS